MTTQEIHQELEKRARKKITYKHLSVLMECFGDEIDETNLEAFLKYAWE